MTDSRRAPAIGDMASIDVAAHGVAAKFGEGLRSLLGLSRRQKRSVMLIGDAICIPLVMYAALALKAGLWVPVTAAVVRVGIIAALVSMPLFARLGLYRAVVRFMGPRAGLAVAAGVCGSLLILVALSWVKVLGDVGASTLVIFGALLLAHVGASRMSLRWLMLAGRDSNTRVIIYGAAQGGAELAATLLASNQFAPVAFVDDNPALWGTVIAGVRVHDPAQIARLISVMGARRVLLAMRSLTRRRRRDILNQLAPLGVHVQTMPTVAEVLSGSARIDDVQEVDVADLLGREPVLPNQSVFETCIRGKTVLVTGAGGSIGSELCRQIARLQPARLLLLEMSEVALYRIHGEIRRMVDIDRLGVDIVPLLGNAQNRYRMREILQVFAVHTIYHAAAYKHVPIVEQNLIEGLYNNVFATWHTAEAALECKVETFVLVSTDKAVNPPNVMGATKRFAEIVLQGLQQRGSGTRFCMVRFGNVLESSGSVVPLFREQIRRGGPVTVTHPEVARYFMTIPEAAQLVVQAGSMAQGGDVFVLDMGKPIKIVDLARRMIQLSGLTIRDADNPHGEIQIHYTGLRPAEKLFEELLIGKNVTGTEHPMILRAVEHALPWEDVERFLGELAGAMRRFDCRAAREIMQRAVAEYEPPTGLQDIIWLRRSELSMADPTEAKIMELHALRRSSKPAAQGGAVTRAD